MCVLFHNASVLHDCTGRMNQTILLLKHCHLMGEEEITQVEGLAVLYLEPTSLMLLLQVTLLWHNKIILEHFD